jgi:hypothetical protein
MISSAPQVDERLILNEAVNFEKECIFIAIPKTGTTSLRSQLRQQGTALIPNPHLNILQVKDSLYLYFLRQALGTNYSFPSELTPLDEDLRFTASQVFDNFFKFSAVRNPWARSVSLYFRREGVQTREKMTFDEFCRLHMHASDTCRQPTLHHNQLDWLCDKNGKCIMDYVYRLEDFELAVHEIAERTDGRIRLESKMSNVNPNSGSRAYRDLYTEETKRLIADRFQKDIDFFKYTF